MTAQQNGESYWDTGGNGGDTMQLKTLEMKADMVTDKVLEQLQELVQILVELKDTERLLTLLSCTREVFRRADECMSQGKTMSIADSQDSGWN